MIFFTLISSHHHTHKHLLWIIFREVGLFIHCLKNYICKTYEASNKAILKVHCTMTKCSNYMVVGQHNANSNGMIYVYIYIVKMYSFILLLQECSICRAIYVLGNGKRENLLYTTQNFMLFSMNLHICSKLLYVRCCSEVISGIVLKVLNARTKTKQLGVDICLMYIELGKQEVVVVSCLVKNFNCISYRRIHLMLVGEATKAQLNLFY